MRQMTPNAGDARDAGAARPTRVAGIDLAAEAAGTALAVLRVKSGGSGRAALELESLLLGADDDAIVRGTRDASLIGIDCALGWPVDFVEFVGRHVAAVEREPAGGRVQRAGPAAELEGSHEPPAPAAELEGGRVHPPAPAAALKGAQEPPAPAAALPATGDLAWRRHLAYRETDRVVTERTGARPLSVATDRLGMTALRCAVLLDRLAGDGRVVDRSGEHPSAVVEVYPAMALRVWGLARPGYKSANKTAAADARLALINDLERAAPWLRLGDHRALMHGSADALDAVLAGLVALAHGVGASIRPTPDQRPRARVEGWISIPTVGLAELGAIL